MRIFFDNDIVFTAYTNTNTNKAIMASLDDVPVGGGGSSAAFADEMAEATENFDDMRTEDLFVSSNWKARKEGLDRVIREAEGSSTRELLPAFLDNLPKFSKENNAAVLEGILEATSALLSKADPLSDGAIRHISDHIVKVAIEKGIVGRPRAVQASITILTSLTGFAMHEDVVQAIVASLQHKTPKNRQAALNCLATIIKEYGLAHLPAKAMLKAVSPLFNDSNALVRKEAQNVFCQCYKYLGAGIKAFLDDLRDVQAQEMMKMFEDLQVGQQPEKVIKGYAPAAAKRVAALTSDGYDNKQYMDDETFQLFDESPLMSKLPKNFFTTVLDKGSKWQERCAIVRDTLCPLLQVPRLRGGDDYHELVKTLRELFLDPNAPLMLISIQCIQSLCRALRQGMGPFIRPLFGPLFEKMKDKKTSVIEHMHTTLSIMLQCKCAPMDALQDEIEATALSKVPNQRNAMMAWLMGVLDNPNIDKSQWNKFPRAHGMLLRLVGDEKVENRELALQLVSKMATVFGDRALQPLISQLDAKQLTKVFSAGSATTVPSALDGSLLRPQTQSTASAAAGMEESPISPPKKIFRVEKQGPEGTLVKALSATSLAAAQRGRQGTLSSLSGRSTASSQADSKKTTPATTPNAPGDKGDDPVALESGLPSREESYAKLNTMFAEDDNCISQLGAKEWKVRFDAAQRLGSMIQTVWTTEMCTNLLENLVVVIKNEVGWKESIFQVVNAVLGLLLETVRRAEVISNRCAFTLIQGFTSRLTEVKSKQPVRELLTHLAEGVTPKFMMKHVIAFVVNAKNPKLTQEANEWFTKLILEFPTAPIDAKAIVEYVKQYCFDQSSPQVKSSAIQLVVAMRLRVGAKLDVFFSDVNPHIKATIDAEVAKGSSTTAGEEIVVRQLKQGGHQSSAPAAPVAITSQPQRASTGESEDFPRTDISQQLLIISKEIVGGKDWKARSVAVQRIGDLINDAHKHIHANGVSDTLKALRTRFEESNKNLVVDALRMISLVLEAAGLPASRIGLRAILPNVLSLLSDQKSNLREEATKVSYAGFQALGLEVVIPMAIKPLSSEALTSRQIAGDLLEKSLQEHLAQTSPQPLPRSLLAPLVPVILRLAMDRTVDVRAVAERLVGHVLPLIGPELFHKGLMDLKPAEQQIVRPMLERRFAQLAPTQAAQPSASSSLQIQQQLSGSVGPSAGYTSVAADQHSQAPPVLLRPAVPVPPINAAFARSVDTHGPIASFAPPGAVSAQGSAAPPSSSRGNALGSSRQESDQPLTPQEILVGLRHASAAAAFRMCSDFTRRFRKGEDCGTLEMISAMVTRLHDNTTHLDPDLTMGLISCLSAMFDSPRCALRCDHNSLHILFGKVFSCLLSEQFALHDSIIKSLNSMTLRMLEGCPINFVFSSLMSLMADYSTKYLETASRVDLKFVQVVVKCLMRLELESVTPDIIILSCHSYLLQHPPSAFKSRDDLSIRTIKTILQTISKKFGRELLGVADQLVGSQNLVSHFIRACLESKEKALRQREAEQITAAHGSERPTSIAERSTHVDPTASEETPQPAVRVVQPLPVQYAPSSSSTATSSALSSANSSPSGRRLGEESYVAAMFNKIRNHQLSFEGLDELYQHLRVNPHCPEFVQQFHKCSDSFRAYIKRRLDKMLAEDSRRPSEFRFPDVLQNLKPADPLSAGSALQ